MSTDILVLQEDWKGYKPVRRRPGNWKAQEAAVRSLVENHEGFSQKKRALCLEEAMTTDSFPLMFGDILGRELQAAFKPIGTPLAPIFLKRSYGDFETHKIFRTEGLTHVLDLVLEKGEYLAREQGEEKVEINLDKYGNQVDFSWEASLRDDLGAFTRFPGELADSASNTSARLQTATLIGATGPIAAAFVDAEHALDPIYAEKLGVNIDDLLVSQPDTGEQALEITDMLVRSGAVDIVVVDSVAALTPKAEIEGDMGDSHMGLQARLMSQALRKLTANIKRSNTLVIFINQIRMKIGVMFGNPETTTGGNALKFYASVRLDIRRIGAIKKGDEILGNETRVKVVKNKVAPPFKQVEFDILYGQGISREGELIDLGVQQNIVEKSGAWYSYNGTRIGQGKDNVRGYLKENPEMAAEIEAQIREAMLPKPVPKAAADLDDAVEDDIEA